MSRRSSIKAEGILGILILGFLIKIFEACSKIISDGYQILDAEKKQ